MLCQAIVRLLCGRTIDYAREVCTIGLHRPLSASTIPVNGYPREDRSHARKLRKSAVDIEPITRRPIRTRINLEGATMSVVTMREMLDSGVHFGHQTRRWNPKMKRFIFTERNGIYIIDLQQSLSFIDRAYEFVKETVAHVGNILFVGTKKQAQSSIVEQATRVGMPYVDHRWLGGMLINFATVLKRGERLNELEEIDFDDVAGSGHTKKELLLLERELEKLRSNLGGIRNMNR